MYLYMKNIYKKNMEVILIGKPITLTSRQDMYTAKSSYIWNAKILDITIYMNFKKTYRISSIGADRIFRDFAVYMSCLGFFFVSAGVIHIF